MFRSRSDKQKFIDIKKRCVNSEVFKKSIKVTWK